MNLGAELGRIIDRDRVLTRWIDRIAFANDASVYRLVPAAVVLPRDVSEIRALLRFSRKHRIPLTFRAAGTSLSGQAVTAGILAVLSRGWREVTVEEAGKKVRVQPGAIGGIVNLRLRPYGTKIGPDPASINACMMGGILANNSSGMCCGVEQNAYHTLDSMRFVLPGGIEVDSARADADRQLEREAPELTRGLMRLRQRVLADEALVRRIRRKYAMKNTMGYSLNALIDHDGPVQILAHLMIGSEGTLGFIAEAVLRTVPDYPHKHTGLLFFDDVQAACAAIAPLRESGARALELMDRASLRAVQDRPGMPEEIPGLPPAAAALLAEYQCESLEELEERRRACERVLPELPLRVEPGFTRDADRQAALWRVRKGLIPSVGAVRTRGSSFIIEDVVFPVDRLAAGVTELQELFARYRYDDAIVFGHAKDGNLHFVLTQSFQNASDVARYDGFMKSLADLVAARHGGALKAEHGTGRNMAPFVIGEWGRPAYAVMCELKRLIDPAGLLNPDVILNEDPNAHVTHLKSLPEVEAEVDPCIECGFCEPMCPSRDLTLTPRQRIVVRREMMRLRQREPGSPVLRELERDFDYAALRTCATDGMCALACPVAIDTGALVKRLRRDTRGEVPRELARILARRFGTVQRVARLLLRVNSVLRWVPDLPRAARPSARRTAGTRAEAIYFPSCVTRVLGSDAGSSDPPLGDVLETVARRAGCRIRVPEGVAERCCGMAFSSKGYEEAYRDAIGRTVASLWEWSGHGAIPVVTDTSPCARTLLLAGKAFDPALRILDGIEFAHDVLLPRLEPRPAPGAVVLHPVCSVHRMDLGGKLRALARACAERVEVPIEAGCCGFAGDRGFSVPELTASALAGEAAAVRRGDHAGYYSSSRTCEIGLARATGRPYRSFWYLLEEATRGSDGLS